MIEYDSEFTDPELNRILKVHKTSQYLDSESRSFEESMSMLNYENPQGSISKSDTSVQSMMDAEDNFEAFGFDALQTLTKTYNVPREIDLDGLLKSASGMEKVTLELMKIHRAELKKSGSTGTVSEEMMSFFEKYAHLFTESAKQSVLMAIKCLDYPLFLRLMRDRLALV
jgi:hypothetical protein